MNIFQVSHIPFTFEIIDTKEADLVVVENDKAKYNRILSLYTKLLNDEIINKKEEAKIFNVAERSIQRDIEDLHCFLT